MFKQHQIFIFLAGWSELSSHNIRLIDAKFAIVGPNFGPLPSIMARLSMKGFPPDFFRFLFLELSLSWRILKNKSLETFLCSPCLSSLSSCPGRPNRIEKSSCNEPNCLENANTEGRPCAKLPLMPRIIRTTTEIRDVLNQFTNLIRIMNCGSLNFENWLKIGQVMS